MARMHLLFLEEPPSCTRAVRAALRGAQEPVTFAELLSLLGQRWMKYEVSSVLAKLSASGYVVALPPVQAGKKKGKRYELSSKPPVRRSASELQPACGQCNPCQVRRADYADQRFTRWDHLVSALAPCHA